MAPQMLNAGPGDELTIIEFNPLQVVASLQVLQGVVSDQRQIVQLQDGQVL